MRLGFTAVQTARTSHWLRAGTAALALAVTPFSADAQEEWPTETIEVISHASPGGGTDTTIRMWMPAAQELVDEDMVVVYKQGGGARAAQEYFQNQGGDGHTIMALTQTHLYTIARGNSPISMDDMIGVVRAMDDPSVIVVRSDSDYRTYEELIDASKEQPLNWGVGTIGSTEHIGIARWAEAAGVDFRVVPFGGGGEMISGLRSGAVDATLANVSEGLSAIQEGDLKGLAVLAEERVADLPDVPSSYEFGHDVSVSTTRGYAVHKDTPPEVVDQIEQLILQAMESEQFRNYLRKAGLNPETNIAGREVWNQQLQEEYAVSARVLKDLGLVKN